MAVIRDKYILDIDTKGANRSIKGVNNNLAGIAGKVGGIIAVGTAFVNLAGTAATAMREFETINQQLQLITNSTAELEAITAVLRQTASQNRSTFAETVDLYQKLKLATSDLGISQERLVTVTGKFQQALALSNADANTAAGAIRQFGQAMASGTVRGDEFNSIVEAMGSALNIMAQESGITVGKLREMSQNGELTAEAFFEMLEGAEGLTAAFNSTTATTAQLETQIVETFKQIVQQSELAKAAASGYRFVLEGILDLLQDIAGVERVLQATTAQSILEQVKTGALDAAVAIKEMEERIFDLMKEAAGGSGRLIITPEIKAQQEALEETIKVLKTLKVTQDETKASNEAATEVIDQQLTTLTKHKDLLDEYSKISAKVNTQTQSFADKQAEALTVISDLMTVQSKLNLETEAGRNAFAQITSQIEIAKDAYFEFEKQANSLAGTTSSLDKFYDKLVEGARKSTTEQTNAQLAIERLKNDLASGKINIDQYAIAMERLNTILGRTSTVGQDAAKTFSQGWKTAFDEYKKNAMDASALAERAFRQSTQGLEDAIVSFAKTGKFEWKEFVLGIQEELLRANIKQVIVNTLQQGGNLTDVMKQFGGISGGAISIPQSELNTLEQLNRMGQFNSLTQGIGGGTLQPTSTNVTYNIDAVDAMSFKSLVARDPEFIHAVAEAGARMSPGRR